MKQEIITPRLKTNNSSLRSQFRIKTEYTTDTKSLKPLVCLPAIQNKSLRYSGLPLMNDDFRSRKCSYK